MNKYEIEKILFILCSENIEIPHIQRVVKNIRYRFPNFKESVFTTDDKFFDHYSKNKELNLVKSSLNAYNEFKVVVLILGNNNERILQEKIDYNRTRVYEADSLGMIRYTKLELDDIEYPFENRHIFNQIASNLGNERIAYFPYSYITQYVGLGPINQFGHRVDPKEINAIQNREKDTKLIVITGGSAAWSIHTNYDEMFANCLEKKLNSENLKYKFKVLNFAQPSAVILNNIFDYILHVQRLKPDLVIFHSGANDLAFGQTSDELLVGEHSIIYQFQFEDWAKILETDRNYNPKNPKITFKEIKNYPRTIIGALKERILQFKTIVESTGGKFLFGLQPMSFSKQAISTKEKESLKKYSENFFKPIMDNLNFLFNKCEYYLTNDKSIELINFHKEFNQYNESYTLFTDQVHTTP
ncbi:MAG TPA: SGNH/GDSL hydrolase family protein, partial [Leptospiraceae bacterium]|nr:SGNH/GDSL hydrolase family protein [Leptospiraceae bacterium]